MFVSRCIRGYRAPLTCQAPLCLWVVAACQEQWLCRWGPGAVPALDGTPASLEPALGKEEARSGTVVAVIPPGEPCWGQLLAILAPGCNVPKETSHRVQGHRELLGRDAPSPCPFHLKKKISSTPASGPTAPCSHPRVGGMGTAVRKKARARARAKLGHTCTGWACSPKWAARSQTVLMAGRSNCVINSASFWQ